MFIEAQTDLWKLHRNVTMGYLMAMKYEGIY